MEIKESKKAKKELRDLPLEELNEKEMSAVQGGESRGGTDISAYVNADGTLDLNADSNFERPGLGSLLDFEGAELIGVELE